MKFLSFKDIFTSLLQNQFSISKHFLAVPCKLEIVFLLKTVYRVVSNVQHQKSHKKEIISFICMFYSKMQEFK